MDSWIKDPDAVLDWTFDWSAWLDNPETIVTSTVVVPAGIAKDSDHHDDTTATVWLSGGAAGQTYRVTNRVVTSAGRADDRSITIYVRDR